jgi:hypothetical protein
VNLVINARTDLYLRQIGDPATRFDATCERSQAYIDAGADCVFVPGVTDEDTIRRFVETLHFPLNVLAMAGTPPIRASTGTGGGARQRRLRPRPRSHGTDAPHRPGTEARRYLPGDVTKRHPIQPQPPLRKIAGYRPATFPADTVRPLSKPTR